MGNPPYDPNYDQHQQQPDPYGRPQYQQHPQDQVTFQRVDPYAAPQQQQPVKPKIINAGTIIALVAGILVLVGAFMDWVTMSASYGGYSMSVGAKIGDMAEECPEVWIVPIMGILIIIMPFIKFPIGSTIMGIIAMIIPIETYVRLIGEFGDYVDLSLGIGSIIIIVGGILAIVGGPLAHKMSKVVTLPPRYL